MAQLSTYSRIYRNNIAIVSAILILKPIVGWARPTGEPNPQ
jgi:hypothetical protein